MIASVLRLNRVDVSALKITDPYSLHRVVYDLFDDVKVDAEPNTPRRILYVDKGGDFQHRQILILSDQAPQSAKHGGIESRPIPDTFLNYQQYRFEVTVNPTQRDSKSRKIVPIRGQESVMRWFIDRAPETWGFSVHSPSLQVHNLSVKQFTKKGHLVTLGSATLQGNLTVITLDKFKQSFCHGIGRGRAFGFGLLQLVPNVNPFKI